MARLQKLVLRNFKSFKKADIPISRGFTAIVGSNGSGKTNILDALLFVLGISSMKMLRVSKINELVNTDAAENYAKVELVLKHNDQVYTIQRMIDKQGKCVYRLDGKRKTRNEISSLLLELGIKPEGHNIVVQGDTTRVIEMNPVERRQIIDELAGLQEFDAKKEEALNELEKVDVKLRDAGIVMQERENYLEQLRQDKEAASEFGALQAESQGIKATIIFSEISELEEKESKGREKLGLIGEERKKIEESVGKELMEKAKARNRAEELSRQILSENEKIYSTVGAKLEAARTGKALLQERIEGWKNGVSRNRARSEALKAKASGIEREIEGQGERVREINSQLAMLEKELKGAREKKASLQELAAQREKKLGEMNALAEQLSSGLDALNERLFEKRSSLGILKSEASLKKSAMKETMQEIEEMQAMLSQKEKKHALLMQLRKKFGNIREELSKAEKARDKALEELKEAEAERNSASEALELLKKSSAQCPVCEAQLAAQKRQALASKKESRLREIMEKAQLLKRKSLDAEERLSGVRAGLEKESQLVAETAGLEEMKQRLRKSRNALEEAKKWLSADREGGLAAEIKALSEEAGEKKSALNAQKEKARAFGESIGHGQLQQAIEAAAKLERQEQSLRQEKESIASSSEKHFAERKKEALAEAQALEAESKGISDKIRESESELGEKSDEIAGLEKELAEAEKQGKKMAEEKEKLDRQLDRLEESSRAMQARLKAFSQEENALLIEKSRAEVRLADLREEFQSLENVQRIDGKDAKELNARLAQVEERIRKLGAINMKAIESFAQLEAEVQDVRKKVEKLDSERLAVVEMIEKIDVKRTSVFMQCFGQLNGNFSKMFNTLFGGEGFLELSDKERPLEAGLLIQARHKGDSIRNIDSMSGGEKTMTALAFLFAIQLYEPAPFYVFDEADAALDKENSIKMAKIIKEISGQSQFIAITHNDPLVQEANQIIGVALNKQKSSVIGLKLKEKEE